MSSKDTGNPPVTWVRIFVKTFLIGGAFIGLSLISPFIVGLYPVVKNVVELLASTLGLIGVVIVVVPIILYIFKDVVGFAFGAFSDAPLDGYLQNLVDFLKNIQATLERYSKPRMPSKEANERAIATCMGDLYGPHTCEEGSLLKYVKSNLLDKYCTAVHRSEITKTTHITKYNDRFCKWNETTKFRLHNTMAQYSHLAASYDFNYRVWTYCEEEDLEEWLSKFSLTIIIDRKTYLSEAKPTRDSGEFSFSLKNGELSIQYTIPLSLKSVWTDVEITEMSINDIRDSDCHIFVSEPTCGYCVEIFIPDEYVFEANPYIGQRFYDPKGEYIKAQTDSHIKIKIPGWVLPGQMASIRWVRP